MLQPKSILGLVEEYLDTVCGIERATAELTMRTFGYFAEAVGDRDIAEVGYTEVERFQKWILDTGRGKVSANIYLKTARPVFRWAIRRGYLETDPFREVKLFRIPKQFIRIYEKLEFNEMLLNCDDFWRARLLLAKTAGLRRGEVQNLTIGDVDFERKVIYIQGKKETKDTWRWIPKGKDVRTLPLVFQLSAVLTRIIARLPVGQPYLTLTPHRYGAIQALRKSNKLSDRVRKTPDENFRPFERIKQRSGVRDATFHDLRRTCITEWLENGLQPHEVMQLAGHSSVDTTMRYYTATRQSLLERARTASHDAIGATGLEPATS